MTAPLTCTCGCHNAGPHAFHSNGCPMTTHADSLIARLKYIQDLHRHDKAIIDRWILKAQKWEGKFHAVKRENNALRKKLYRDKTEEK